MQGVHEFFLFFCKLKASGSSSIVIRLITQKSERAAVTQAMCELISALSHAEILQFLKTSFSLNVRPKEPKNSFFHKLFTKMFVVNSCLA